MKFISGILLLIFSGLAIQTVSSVTVHSVQRTIETAAPYFFLALLSAYATFQKKVG